MTQFAWLLGGVGVSLFFVLSGFIMVHVCWEDFGGVRASGSFLKRRVIRVVPLYWIGTALAFAYHKVSATHGGNDGPFQLLHSLAFVPYMSGDGSMMPVLPQGWTLIYEMTFYLVFSLGLCFPRKLGLSFVGLALAALVLMAPTVPDPTIAYFGSPVVLWFPVGMASALVWRHWKLREPPALARFGKILEPWGDASYSTYLIQGFALTMLLRLWALTLGPASLWIVPASLVVVTAAGWYTHSLVEKPVLRLATQLLNPARRIPVPSASV